MGINFLILHCVVTFLNVEKSLFQQLCMNKILTNGYNSKGEVHLSCKARCLPREFFFDRPTVDKKAFYKIKSL